MFDMNVDKSRFPCRQASKVRREPTKMMAVAGWSCHAIKLISFTKLQSQAEHVLTCSTVRRMNGIPACMTGIAIRPQLSPATTVLNSNLGMPMVLLLRDATLKLY